MGIAGCIEIVPEWPEVPPDVLVVDETLRVPGHLGGTLLTAVLFRSEAAEPSGFDSEVYISADLVRAHIYPGVDRLRSHSNRDLDQRRSGVARRLRERAGEPGIDQLLTQPFFVSTPWTEKPGVFVPAATGLVEAEAYLAGSPSPE
jgi:F0F1-type ATP synthase beta subunit